LPWAAPYLGLAERLQQRPAGQDPGQVPPVVGGGVDVGLGVDLLAGQVGGGGEAGQAG
jgi:hypothetical protein